MSAANASVVKGLAPGPTVTDLNEAVDPFDAAARLESAGFGDLSASRRGFSDIFHQAAEQFRIPSLPNSVTTPLPDWVAGMWRAIAMASGVVVCLCTLSINSGAVEGFAAGAGCWFVVQVVGAILWWGLGQGKNQDAARIALVALPLFGVVSAVLSLALGDIVVVAWTLWGWSSAVGACLRPGRGFSLSCLAAACFAVVTRFVLAPGLPTAGGLIVIAVATVLACRVLLFQGGWGPMTALTVARPVRWMAACVVVQLLGIWLIYISLDHAFIAVAIGAIVGSAANEVVGDGATYLARRFAATCSSWRTARWMTGGAGLVGILVVSGISIAAACWFASWWQIPITFALLTAVPLVTTIGCGVSYSLRFGSATEATLIAAIGLGLIAIAVLARSTGTEPLEWAVGVLLISVGFAVSAARLASPRAW